MIFNELLSAFNGQLMLLALIYILVLLVVFLDLWSGIRKAKQRKEYRSSYGLRKTVEKIAKYFNMLFVITTIDIIQMLAIHNLNPQVSFRFPIFPFLSIAGAMFVGFIELKSIYEKADDKQKSKMSEAAKLTRDLLADKNAVDAVTKIAEYLKSEPKD